MRHRGLWVWICLFCQPGSTLAADSQGVVVQVPSGSSLILEDGRTVKLLGLAEANTRSSQQWLEIYALGRVVTLRHEIHSGFAEARAMPVLWDRMDVCGLMLLGGHGKLQLAGDEPAAAVRRWTAYQQQAKRAKLGLWTAPEAQPLVLMRPTEIRVLPPVTFVAGSIPVRETVRLVPQTVIRQGTVTVYGPQVTPRGLGPYPREQVPTLQRALRAPVLRSG